MAIRNDHDDYDWATPRRGPPERRPQGLHNYHDDHDDLPKPSLQETALELVVTLGGIVGVFFLIITLVKAFH